MKALAEHIISNPESFSEGGLVVVSIVIFLMGLVKMAFKNMQNKSLRRSILAILSVALTLPVTCVIMWVQGSGFTNFWLEYAFNAFATVFAYWGYEVTGAKSLVSWLESQGKKVFTSVFHHKKNIPDIIAEIHKESLVEIKQSYDDDLKI